MGVKQAIYERCSRRAFRPEPVAKRVILQLLEGASRAPSARNLQPWKFVVVSGLARERLSQRLVAAYEAEVAAGQTLVPPSLPPLYQARLERFNQLWQDQAPAFDLVRGSLNFYGAPVVILVGLEQGLPPERLFDLGAAVQNFLLLAQEQGLGTCVIGIAIRYQELIKEELKLPRQLELVTSVAVGYPDPEPPWSALRPARVELGDLITWIS